MFIFKAGNWILLFSILAKILVVSCRVYLYLKRDPGARLPSPPRHHNSLAAKYVSLTDEQRRQLEHLEHSTDDEEEDDRFREIPFADQSEQRDNTERERTIHNTPSSPNETKHLLTVNGGEKSYQNKSYSSNDSGPLQTSSTAQLKLPAAEASSSEDNLLNDHSFKYNTL